MSISKDCVFPIWATRHLICTQYVCYGLPLKTDSFPLPLSLSILILKITGILTIMFHAHKVVKRLMLRGELINDLEALCHQRSLRLHYSMTAGQRVGVGAVLITHIRIPNTSVKPFSPLRNETELF